MRVFEISTLKDRTSVHAGESSSLNLTVTNKSENSLNCLIRIIPDNQSHSSWISAQGGNSRNFAVAETQNLTIQFNPPINVKPENAKCRIILADDSNPDENFSDIILQYEVKEPREIPKRKIWPWILIACGVIALIAGLIWLFSKGKPSTPVTESTPVVRPTVSKVDIMRIPKPPVLRGIK